MSLTLTPTALKSPQPSSPTGGHHDPTHSISRIEINEEQTMRRINTSIDAFLQAVLINFLNGPGSPQQVHQSQSHRCATASSLAMHLILELYDQGSSDHANILRISSNLEMVAEELLYLSRRIKNLDSL